MQYNCIVDILIKTKYDIYIKIKRKHWMLFVNFRQNKSLLIVIYKEWGNTKRKNIIYQLILISVEKSIKLVFLKEGNTKRENMIYQLMLILIKKINF